LASLLPTTSSRFVFCLRLTSEVELPKASHWVLKGPIPVGGDLRTTSLGVGGVNGLDRGQVAKAKYRYQNVAKDYEIGNSSLGRTIYEALYAIALKPSARGWSHNPDHFLRRHAWR
jgi:hypothetical protein